MKRALYEKPEYIVDVLEKIGCHSTDIVPNVRVSSALPDGDNAMSVQVLIKNDNLVSVIHTRPNYQGGDIFSLIEFIHNCSFSEAFTLVGNVLGVTCSMDVSGGIKSESYNFLSNFLSGSMQQQEAESRNIPMSDNILDSFIKAPHQMFIDDHISVGAQQKFDICYDIKDDRVLIPIRDTQGDIVTLKGRTADKDWEKKGKAKYVAYYPYSAREILFGYYENYFNILASKEVVLVESEKAVMQGWSYSQKNIVALSKKQISEPQLELIIALGVDVVFALDNDVPACDIEVMAEAFRGVSRVFYIKDELGLLKSKDSPLDRGREVWMRLYNGKKEIVW